MVLRSVVYLDDTLSDIYLNKSTLTFKTIYVHKKNKKIKKDRQVEFIAFRLDDTD